MSLLPSQAKAASFADTPDGVWYVEEGWIDYASSHGLMTGLKDKNGNYTGMFDPEAYVTRGQAVTVLYRIANPDSTATTNAADYVKGTQTKFPDLPRGPYYYNAAVKWATEQGIVTGYTDGAVKGKFGPEDKITRQDLATMVWRFAKAVGVDVTKVDSSAFNAAGDNASVEPYAKEAMKWCASEGVLTGFINIGPKPLLQPRESATRAQAAKIFSVLYRDVLRGGAIGEPPEGIVYVDEAKVITPPTYTENSNGSVTFATKYLPAGLSVGDYLIIQPDASSAYEGCALKVTGVKKSGSSVTVSGTTPKLDEIVKSVNVSGSATEVQDIVLADGVSLTGNSTAGRSAREIVDLGELEFTVDFAKLKLGTGSVTLGFEDTIDFDLNISLIPLTDTYFKVTNTFTQTLSADFEIKKAVEVPLTSLKLYTSVKGITLDVVVFLKADASGQVSCELGHSYTFDLQVGFKSKASARSSPVATNMGPELELRASAGLAIYLTLLKDIKVVDVTGEFGEKIEASSIMRTQDNLVCTDAKVGPFIEVSSGKHNDSAVISKFPGLKDLSTFFGDIGFTFAWTKDFGQNSMHFENGSYVKKCTWGVPKTYTVSFNSNGGSSIGKQTVKQGEVAKKPSDPYRKGYIFDGWYSDSKLTKKYDFNAKVTANITLYAKWQAESANAAYAMLYEDGTLVFQRGSEQWEGVALVAKWTGFEDVEYDWLAGVDTPWASYASKVKNVITTGIIKPKSLTWWFRDFANCGSISLDGFDTSAVDNFSHLFDGCRKLTELDMASLDTSNATTMNGMFSGCSKLTSLDLKNFNTSKVIDFASMFYGCSSLVSLDTSSFDTSSGKYFGQYETNFGPYHWGMFYGCESLTELDLSNFDTSSAVSFNGMFTDCESLTYLNVSSFETSNVIDMGTMFYRCSSLKNIDISSFNVSNVKNFNGMFQNCFALDRLDLNNFVTSSVNGIGLVSMFANCKSIRFIEMDNFDTSECTSFNYMFAGCSKLESLGLGSFDTSSAKIFTHMFDGCETLQTLDIANFITPVGEDFSGMFIDCYALEELDISGLDTRRATNMNVMFSMDDAYGYLTINKIMVGDNFNIKGNGTIEGCFPEAGAARSTTWYNSKGEGYLANEIPFGVADTYTRTKPQAASPVEMTPPVDGEPSGFEAVNDLELPIEPESSEVPELLYGQTAEGLAYVLVPEGALDTAGVPYVDDGAAEYEELGGRYVGPGAYVTGWYGASDQLMLPAELEGQPVVSANLSWGDGMSQLAEVVGPDAEGCMRLVALDLSGCVSLSSLDVSGNALTVLDLAALTVPDGQMPSLRFLDASANLLTALDISPCPALEFLDASANAIADITALDAWLADPGHRGSVSDQLFAAPDDGTLPETPEAPAEDDPSVELPSDEELTASSDGSGAPAEGSVDSDVPAVSEPLVIDPQLPEAPAMDSAPIGEEASGDVPDGSTGSDAPGPALEVSEVGGASSTETGGLADLAGIPAEEKADPVAA